ncbi:MAG TPA: S-methyl-5'-thioadenosine phosphorylase, partial [Chthoniobacteraceae bacterium]|nr:S-methyl-5'-thioadenosine phosphorylase [Chthoniobacteraceae bacterium]
SRRAEHTFFGEGIAAHVGFADPISTGLRQLLAATGEKLNYRIHNGGTYVNMDGPAFSTRAESETHRKLGFDVIGMTNLGEAKLAREAEIALATLAMITDYDCWKVEEEAVTAHAVVEHLHANAAAAKAIIASAIPNIPLVPDWPEHRALDHALITAPHLWPAKTRKKLEAILKRFKPVKNTTAAAVKKKRKRK